MDKIKNLERLNALLDQGSITESEYESLKREVVDGDQTVEQTTRIIEETSQTETSTEVGSNRYDASTLYKFALGMGVLSVFFGGTFGLLAWATVGASGWVLYSTQEANKRWMAWTGLALGLTFSFMNLYLNGHFSSASTCSEGEIPISMDAPNPGVRTFGATVDDAEKAWTTCNGSIERRQRTIGPATAFLPGEHIADITGRADSGSELEISYYHPSGWGTGLFLTSPGVNDQDGLREDIELVCNALIGLGLETPGCVDEVIAATGTIEYVGTSTYYEGLLRRGEYRVWRVTAFENGQTSVWYHTG